MKILKFLGLIAGIGLVIYLIFLIGYIRTLDKEHKDYIKKIYKRSLIGTINYIKDYEKNPDTYVISILDSVKIETTIGKVEITNFSKVKLGDTLYKRPNSFELEIRGKSGKINSVVKFNPRKSLWGF